MDIEHTVANTNMTTPTFVPRDHFGIAQAFNRGAADLYRSQLASQTTHKQTLRAAVGRNPNIYTAYHAHTQAKTGIPWDVFKK